MTNQSKLLVVDVDLTIVASDLSWLEWLRKRYPQILNIPEKDIDYNLAKYFDHQDCYGCSGMDYWNQFDLYDNLPLIEGCYEALEALKSAGFNFAFTSHTKSGHFSSKTRMLKKIPFVDFSKGDAYVATHEKGVLSDCAFAVIDDRNKFLNQFGDSVLKVKYDTPYTQCEEPTSQYDLITNDWSKIKDFIIDMS